MIIQSLIPWNLKDYNMKASDAYIKLSSIRTHVIGFERSKVDETKTLSQMFTSWMNLFEAYPDMRIGSILKYNINRDFDCL